MSAKMPAGRQRAGRSQPYARHVPTGADRPPSDRPSERVAVGRRVFLGMAALGAVGIAFGAKAQSMVATISSKLGNLAPGSNHFRIYSVSGTLPQISPDDYRLVVSGLVEHPTTFTLADLEAMPKTALVRDFHCVTGWEVPQVHWEGVLLSEIMDAVGIQSKAVALSFDSYDQTDSESLTLDQARRSDVIVAYRMLGAPVTTEHGGPVRLYVAPMFGYKSLKWLSGIRVVDAVEPGFWEENGYPVNAWIDGSTGNNDS
jgi:DMSO/TMAO reductase YedYZ molybdopterin-dependent catalytic subunit